MRFLVEGHIYNQHNKSNSVYVANAYIHNTKYFAYMHTQEPTNAVFNITESKVIDVFQYFSRFPAPRLIHEPAT